MTFGPRVSEKPTVTSLVVRAVSAFTETSPAKRARESATERVVGKGKGTTASRVSHKAGTISEASGKPKVTVVPVHNSKSTGT